MMINCKTLPVCLKKLFDPTLKFTSVVPNKCNLNSVHRCFGTTAARLNQHKILVHSGPIVSFNNWCYGHLVREYFKQEFDLKEFCNYCPIILKQIVDCLVENETEYLKEAVKEDCLTDIINKWKQISPDQRKRLANLKTSDIMYAKPTIKIQLPGKFDPLKELPGFLHISILMFFFIEDDDMIEKGLLGNKNLPNFNIRIALPILHKFMFVREITKGVDDSWTLESSSFPSLTN